MKRLFLTALATLAGVASANPMPPIKPGLWEMKQLSTEIDGKPVPTMAQIAPQMAQMPPEIRKMMEEKMRAQGIDMQGGAIRTCVSAEMLKQNHWGQNQQGKQDCKMDVLDRSGSTWRWKVQCKEGNGEGQTQFDGSEGYTTEMHWKGTQKGAPQQMKARMQGRWLGSDCGGLKPINVPAPTDK